MKRILVSLLLIACVPAGAQTAWLLGELHDQPDHQRQAAQIVDELAVQGRLQALVLEMAERGRHTHGLPRDAGEAQVREALAWHEPAWPWAAYGPVVMAAVRAGVPVQGGNLPRAELRAAMGQARWDDTVPASARERLVDAVRDGHCGLVPEAQLPAMARMQIARDDALAATIAASARGASPEAVVLLLTGASVFAAFGPRRRALAPAAPGPGPGGAQHRLGPRRPARAGRLRRTPLRPEPTLA